MESGDLLVKNIDVDESLFIPDQCDSRFNSKDDIIVEAKSIILNEQLEKIVNLTLREVYTVPTKKTQKSNIPVDDEETWKVPAPQKCLQVQKSTVNPKVISKTLFDEIEEIREKYKQNRLSKKYFNIWKCKIKLKKRKKQEDEQKDTSGNLDEFINTLKKIQITQKNKIKKEKSEVNPKKNEEIKKKKSEEKGGNKQKSECYVNRYKAQQNIILMQRCKLLEQEKLIEELKFGKATDELTKSLEDAEKDMKEIYKYCSVMTKCKLGLPNPTSEELIQIKTNKVPKIVRQMEERAKERLMKQNIIRERKRIIEEERARITKETIERKQMQDEEERKKCLEAIKLRRIKEMEAERARKVAKEIYLKNMQKVERFYNRKLKRRVMRALKRLMEIKEENEYKADMFYECTVEKIAFDLWRNYVVDVWKEKERIADEFYKRKMCRRFLFILQENRRLTIVNQQVATDYYNRHLQYKTLRYYHLYVCKMVTRRNMLYIKAEKHYKNHILVQYFYQWKSLKAVLQLEKAKEEKRKKWREKVLEIIPDYQPLKEDD